jgi:rubrerythrin
MSDIQNLSSAQAVYVAARMEQRAVALYERALMVFAQGRMKDVLQDLLKEEQAHLRGFQRLQEHEGPVGSEDGLLLDALAGEALFTGGLTGAVREGAFDSPLSLLRYAADEEERAAARYRQFAEKATGETKETFLLIARQEQRHLERLLGQIFLMEESLDA